MKREKTLQKLLDAIVEEMEIEPDKYMDYAVVRSSFHIGDIGVWFHSSHNETTLEIINEEYPNRDYTNVSNWLEDRLQRGEVLEMAGDKLQEAYEDEWESHGFRDEADYWHYRLG